MPTLAGSATTTGGAGAAAPRWIAAGRVPVLDGLRAVSIALVVAWHVLRKDPTRRTGSALERHFLALHPGHLGVTWFFVISGFLITLLLLRERARTGAISLGQFYVRRALRLLPAMTVFLVAMAVLAAVTGVGIARRYWIAAVTYMMCLVPEPERAWNIGHLWSLSVEEHFYLLWPLLLARLGPPRAVRLAVGYILATPAIRYAMWRTLDGTLDIGLASPSQMSSIAVGCVLAYALYAHPDRVRAWLVGWRLRALPAVALAALIVALELNRRSWKFHVLFGDPASATCIALLTLGLLLNPGGVIARLLNTRLLIAIGVLSYSLYLWQQPFTGDGRGWLTRLPANVLAPLAIAAASYWLIESPFLRLKARLDRRAPAAARAA